MAQKMKMEQLVEEFHVQVYSTGRIEWDRLDDYLPKQAFDKNILMAHVSKKLGRPPSLTRNVAA